MKEAKVIGFLVLGPEAPLLSSKRREGLSYIIEHFGEADAIKYTNSPDWDLWRKVLDKNAQVTQFTENIFLIEEEYNEDLLNSISAKSQEIDKSINKTNQKIKKLKGKVCA